MNSKFCFKCLIEKPINEFYKHPKMHDGHLNKCKECAKKDVHQKYQENTKDVKFVLKERERTRQKWHRLYQGNKKKIDSEKKKEILNRYFKNHPLAYKAQRTVTRYVNSGKLIQRPCQKCGTKINVQAHHDDYSRPLNVVWLCVKHHNEVHVNKRKEELLNKYQNNLQLKEIKKWNTDY